MLRKIHLDFHTAPETPGIGAGFDPERFADTLAAAHVTYIATPGKCHFGHVYYAAETAIAHPHLADPEMFPRTVAACLARGIRTQSYWTLGLDSLHAGRHPDWRQTLADGTRASWGHYLHMCFASPYVDEIVIPEVLECLERNPGIVGFWFDIALYVDGAFYSDGFNQLAAERLAPGADSLQARWELGRTIIRERCIQIDQAIKQVLPTAENFFNTLVNPGESQNLHLVHLNEVENPLLFGGPEKMTADIRWLRGQGVPTIGLTSRFQAPWSDPGTLRTAQQMRFDVARTVALGCDMSMGDHRYPDGHLEPAVYERLAPIYGELAAMESLLDQARPCTEVLLVGATESGTGRGLLSPNLSPTTKHAARILEELGLQFDLATTDDPWPRTDCIVFLGEGPTSPEIRERLQAHVAAGGALFAMDHAIDGAADLFPAQVQPWQPASTQAVGGMGNIGHAATVGHDASAAGPAGDFIRLDPAFGGEPFSFRLSLPARLLQAAPDATVLAARCAPVSDRPAFASEEPDSPLVVQHGRVVYAAPNLFAEAIAVGSPNPAIIIDAVLRRLLPQRLVQHDAGPTVAAHLHRVSDGYLLHLVHWAMDRWEPKVNCATQFPTLADIQLSLHLPETATRVRCLPDGEALPHAAGDALSFTLPRLHIWQVVHIQV